MEIRKKHTEARQLKKKLQIEIYDLKKKIKKQEKKLAKKQDKLSRLNQKIKHLKKKLRNLSRQNSAGVKSKVKESKKGVKKEKSLVPETEKALRKIRKTKKDLVKTPSKALRKQEKVKSKKVETRVKKNDLKLIKGLGRETERVLNEAGIESFDQMSKMSSEAIDLLLEPHFRNWKSFNTISWPEQALLAAAGKFDRLKDFQSKI